jgi:quinol monooxygenase YgiN
VCLYGYPGYCCSSFSRFRGTEQEQQQEKKKNIIICNQNSGKHSIRQHSASESQPTFLTDQMVAGSLLSLLFFCLAPFGLAFLGAKWAPSSRIQLRMAAPEKIFCVNVNLYVKPERREEFLKIIRNNQAGTIGTEPKARFYYWGESTSTKNLFHFQEQYVGRDGFEAHQKTAHFSAWEKFASDPNSPFSKPPEVMLFETEEPTNDYIAEEE